MDLHKIQDEEIKKIKNDIAGLLIPTFRHFLINDHSRRLKITKLEAEEQFYLNSVFFQKFRIIFYGLRNDLSKCIINKDSETTHVFCNTKLKHENVVLNNIDIIKKFCDSNSNLFYGGADLKIPNRFLEENKSLFRKILVETLETHQTNFNVLAFPAIGNLKYYLKGNVEYFNYSLSNKINFKKNKLISVGHSFFCKGVSKKVLDRAKLQEFIHNNKFVISIKSEPTEYLMKKSEFKFFMCPRGNGVQANKIWESLICNTIPVMTDHPNIRQLKDIYKIPIHIVNDWNEITEENLNEVFEKEYKNYDWVLMKKKFLIDNFFDWVESSINEYPLGDIK